MFATFTIFFISILYSDLLNIFYFAYYFIKSTTIMKSFTYNFQKLSTSWYHLRKKHVDDKLHRSP